MTESELKIATAKRMEEERLLAAAMPPKSDFSMRTDNFVYHNKWLIAAVIFGLIVTAFVLRDVFFRSRPDITIIAVGVHYLHPDYQEWMGRELSLLLSEIREADSLIELDAIRLIADHVPEHLRPAPAMPQGDMEEILEEALSGAELEMGMAALMKLTALLTSGHDPVFLLDAAGFAYHARLAADPRTFEGAAADFVNWIPEQTDFFYPLHAGGDNIYALPLTLLDLPPELLREFRGYSLYLRDTRDVSTRGAEAFEPAREFLTGLIPGYVLH